MRAITSILVMAGCFALLSCDNPGSRAKAPGELNPPDVIVGTWVAKKDESGRESYIVGYEFGPDHSAKVICLNAKEPIKGKYQFTNDYTLKMEYEATAEAKRTFAEASKVFRRSDGETAIQDKGAPTSHPFPEELPKSETFTINVRPVPFAGGGTNAPATPGIELILTNERNFSLVFRKQ
jgi:hypothetical protein